MEDIKYPLYRKLKYSESYMKLNSNGVLIKVLIINETDCSIIHTKFDLWAKLFNNTDFTVDITRDEFEKVYGHAQYKLSKANCEQ
jgi:hypothetical protein